MMMSANLIGFVLGVEGMRYLADELFTTARGRLTKAPRCFSSLTSRFACMVLYYTGIQFMAITIVCLFIYAQVAFEYR